MGNSIAVGVITITWKGGLRNIKKMERVLCIAEGKSRSQTVLRGRPKRELAFMNLQTVGTKGTKRIASRHTQDRILEKIDKGGQRRDVKENFRYGAEHRLPRRGTLRSGGPGRGRGRDKNASGNILKPTCSREIGG